MSTVAEPTETPTTAPEPPPSPPASVPAAGATSAFDAAFPDDGLDSPSPPPSASEAPEKPKADATPPADKPKGDEPTAAPAKADADKAAPTEPGGEFDPPKVAKPSELRSFAMRMGNRAKKAEGEISALRQEVQQLKTRAPIDDGRTAALAQELAAAKKEAQQFREQLRAVSYQKDPDFQKEYVQPRMAAVKEAYRDVSELIAYEPDPEGVEDPKQRPATTKDFDEIYFAPTTTAAINLAKQKFGDAWSIVFEHRKAIRRLVERENTASEEWAKTSQERENAKLAETTKQSEAMVQMFRVAKEAYAKRNPEAYAERPGDAEGNELFQKGQAFADAVFGGNDGLTPQQTAMRDSRAWHWLAAFPRLVRDYKSAKAQVEELKKTIDSVRASGPGKPATTSTDTTPKEFETAESAFDRLVK